MRGTQHLLSKYSAGLKFFASMWCFLSLAIWLPSELFAASPYVNLQAPTNLPSPTGAITPRALVAGDFDEDGMPDVVAAFDEGLYLYSGNVGAVYPNSPGAPPASPALQTPGSAIAVPVSPQFVGSGDFNGDDHWDLVVTGLGSSSLSFLPGNGDGTFGAVQTIALSGTVTAFTTGDMNRRDGLDEVVVGIQSPGGPKVLVFESPVGALQGTPEEIALTGQASALAIGLLGEDALVDLAVAMGSDVVVLHGRDRKLSQDSIAQATVTAPTTNTTTFGATSTGLAIGDFTGNTTDARLELALQVAGGDVHITQFDTGSGSLVTGLTLNENPASALVTTRISSRPTDDLVLLDAVTLEMHILMQDDDLLSTVGAQRDTIAFSARPVALLPVRLNTDAQSDPVLLFAATSTPAVALTAPVATYTVNSTGNDSDAIPGDGICETLTGNGICTLRAGIEEANVSVGADQITFNIAPSGLHTIIPTLPNMPFITDPLTIDGTSQPGFAGSPIIELDVGNGDTCCGGLRIDAGSSVLRGLVVHGAIVVQIDVQTKGGNILEGNFVGIEPDGLTPDTIGGGIGLSNSPRNLVGGTTVHARNVISGLASNGIGIGNGVPWLNNVIQGNFIGTDLTGTVAVGNGGSGVSTNTGPNLIGGTTPGAGNLISGHGFTGIAVGGLAASGNLVQGNIIGTDVTGTTALSNNDGVGFVGGIFNTAGGTTIRARNLISGNTRVGMGVGACLGVCPTNMLVQGNYIGTDVSGTLAILNGNGSVSLNSADDNVIGGIIPEARNIIVGTGTQGGLYMIGGARNVVQGNYIGTDVTGTVSLGGNGGVLLTGAGSGASDNRIGGNEPGTRNLISGNSLGGVRIVAKNATGNVVEGNYIGTDVTGTIPLGNGNGVEIRNAEDNIFRDNVISGNTTGVLIGFISASRNLFENNLIGTDATGSLPLGNTGRGVLIGGGGTSAGIDNIFQFNTIAYNGFKGISILNSLSTGNLIRGNAIFENVGLGIDLEGPAGSNTDPGDSDLGPNNLQNFPVLTAATSAGGTTLISGDLNSFPSTTFTLEFFANTAADPSGFGEGEVPMGTTTVSTDGTTGNGSFAVALPTPLGGGPFITATATDPGNNTSEFSAAFEATVILNQPPVVTLNGSNAANEGDTVNYTFDVTDPDVGDSFSISAGYPDCGTGGSLVAGSTATTPMGGSYSCEFLDGPVSSTVAIQVTDLAGADSNVASIGVTVANVDPEIVTITGPIDPLALGSSASILVDYTDVGSLDTHTCTFSWDDGVSPSSTITSGTGSGSGSCSDSFTYVDAGVYTVTVTVTDNDAGAVSDIFEFVVIYDPTGGFVTGGGFINSLAGAYQPDPSLTGKANFGFVSKYKKGATVPTGQTQFQFKVADLNFHSSSYDWLVIAGHKAQYKGSGTINGVGGYNFLLTAHDGQQAGGGGTDKFRIKIQQTGGGVIYDNKHGTSDDIDAADPQAIGGGSIVIHKK